MARFWIAVESLLATALALYLAVRLGRSTVWLALPVVLLLVLRRPLEEFGLEWRFTPPSLLAHVALGAAALALYTLGYALWVRLVLGESFAPRFPANIGPLALHQLLAVALPEEFFFRGYLQTNLNRAFGKSRSLAGAEMGPGLIVQAVLFALCHLATGDWTHLRVFFFALLAGWLRDRSQSILAPTVYHAAANTWVTILEGEFR